jgi:hypothetical protein
MVNKRKVNRGLLAKPFSFSRHGAYLIGTLFNIKKTDNHNDCLFLLAD